MERIGTIQRETKETSISLQLDLDGKHFSKSTDISTGIGFFDHMLTALTFYGGMSLSLTVHGDLEVDGHHTVEDTGIVFGQALTQAMGAKRGIRRFASAYVPMDEALTFTSLDLSGRPFLVFDAPMKQERIGMYDACLTQEFMRAFALHGGITLHQKAFYGENAHHITEGLFKSLGLALKDALLIDGNEITSTKGVL